MRRRPGWTTRSVRRGPVVTETVTREVGKCAKLPAPFQGGTCHEASEGSARGVGKPRSRSVLPVGCRRERPASAVLSAAPEAREPAGAVHGAGDVGEAQESG